MRQMSTIETYMDIRHIFHNLNAETSNCVIETIAKNAEKNGIAESENIISAIQERESYGTTGIGNEVAIPHGRLKKIDRIYLYVATLKKPLDFNSIDGKGVRIFFIILIPEKDHLLYLKLLSRISMICKNNSFLHKLKNAENKTEIINFITDEDNANCRTGKPSQVAERKKTQTNS